MMNLPDVFLLNTIYLLFPLLLYLLYIAYAKTIGKKENDIFLDTALFSSLYLVVRYGVDLFAKEPTLLVNIPLLIAYIKNRKVTTLLMSFFLIQYYHHFLNCSMLWFFLSYASFYGLYVLMRKFKWNDYIFSIAMMLLLSFYFGIFAFTSQFFAGTIEESLLHFLLLVFVQFLVSAFCILLLKSGEDILKFHLAVKELIREKQIKHSLFQITHEIKNPIAVCKGYLDMFDVTSLEHSKRYIPIIKEEINRTLLLLEDFKCMNQVNVEKDIVDANLIVENVVDSFKPMLKEKGMHYKIELLKDDVEIYADYNRIVQVLFNLIKNSIEAMTPSRGMVEVYMEETKNDVKISIQDNGCGIKEEDLEKIREPFFTTKVKGTGLGVSLSCEIIQAHNGQIEYFSEYKRGTTVVVTLPKYQELGNGKCDNHKKEG